MDTHRELCLGTGQYGTGLGYEQACEQMELFCAAGGRILDTAHIYGVWDNDRIGASEACIGRWIQSRGRRDDLFIMTKGAHPDFKTGKRRVNQQAINSDLKESLERLGCEHIDLYWLHRDDEQIAVEDIAKWMHALIEQKRIRAYGLSNWRIERIQQLMDCCDKLSLRPPAASQIGFSLARTVTDAGQEINTCYMTPETFAWHQQSQFPVYSFSSQASGLFAKCHNYQELLKQQKLNAYKTEANKTVIPLVQELSERYECTSNQLALAALLGCPFPSCPIVGPRTREQLEDSLQARHLTIESVDLEQLLAHWH